MSQIPGPRTSPTVNSGGTRGKRSFEVRLGLVQVVILLGVITGSMACVFFVGFVSGQHVGYQSALNSNVANAVKLPISEEAQDTEDKKEKVAAQVYAKLDEASSNGSEKGPAEMPELGSIQNIENSPVLEPTEAESASSAATKELEGVEVINEEPPTKKTLKDMLADQAKVETGSTDKKEPVKAVEAKPTEKALETHVEKVAEKTPEKKATEQSIEKPTARPTTKPTLPPVETKAPVVIAPRLSPASPPPSAGSKGWFAQVAAPKKEDDATSLASRLRASGFSVRIENAQVGGEQYYRVLVGPEEGKPQADRLIQQLKRENYLKSDPFLRLVR